MRIRRALEVAFYPRRVMTVIFVAIVVMGFVSAAFVGNFPLFVSLSYGSAFLMMTLALKLMFSGIFGQVYGIIVGPYRDDMPVGTMVLLGLFFMILGTAFAAPLLMEAAARSGTPL